MSDTIVDEYEIHAPSFPGGMYGWETLAYRDLGIAGLGGGIRLPDPSFVLVLLSELSAKIIESVLIRV